MVQSNNSYAEMLAAAEALGAMLEPACERLEIAGSIRRQKGINGGPGPNDIELVVIPKIERQPAIKQVVFGLDWGSANQDLSDPVEKEFNLFDARCDQLAKEGILEYRLAVNGNKAWGSGLKRATFVMGKDAYAADLFAVLPPAQWGVIFAIRTGPGDFNHLLVTHASLGGACPWNRKVAGGRVWALDTARDGQRYFGKLEASKFLQLAPQAGFGAISTPEEWDFFTELGVPHWEPPVRTVEVLDAYVKTFVR